MSRTSPSQLPEARALWRAANRDKIAAANRRFHEANKDKRKPLTEEQKAAKNDAMKRRWREKRDEIVARRAELPSTAAYEQSEGRKAWKRAYQTKLRREQPQRMRARRMVTAAVRTGRLLRLPCELCGATGRVEAHHGFGYADSMALAVWWLCPKHHGGMHRRREGLEAVA